MKYIYDVDLFFAENYYKFYEWSNLDNIVNLTKIPIFCVDFNTYKDIITNKIKISDDFGTLIENKSKTKGGYMYKCALFSDYTNVVAVAFNHINESVAYSTVLLDDELNIIENIYATKKYILNYTKIKPINDAKDLKVTNQIKHLIQKELNTKDILKIKYIYNELYDDNENDVDIMKKLINEKLNTFDSKLYDIYRLLKSCV